MYVSIDLSADLRLDAVVLRYITRVFLDEVNLLLCSYKNSSFSWQSSGGNKPLLRAVAIAKLHHRVHGHRLVHHGTVSSSESCSWPWSLRPAARLPLGGVGHWAGCCGTGPQRGGHPQQPPALPGGHDWEGNPNLKLLPGLSRTVVTQGKAVYF